MALVGEHFGLTHQDLTGPMRPNRIARPRQIAMYLMRNYCPHLSYPHIGRLLGGRDHTTVLHGVRKIEDLITRADPFVRHLKALQRKLDAIQHTDDEALSLKIIAAERRLQDLKAQSAMLARASMVLLALADAANDDGVTWIAVKHRAEDDNRLDLLTKCSLSERAVQGALKRLVEAGYLIRKDVPGRVRARTNAPAPRPRGSRFVPDDFQPSAEHRAKAAAYGLTPGDFERALSRFRNHEFPRAYTDWSRCFHNWIDREKPANLSSTLWALLADGPSSQVEEITRNLAMKADCERFHRQLSILAEPAGSEAVERALAPLVLVYGLGEQAKARAFWRVYTDALSDLPRMALDRAAAEYPKVGKFFPKPAEIRELAMPHANALRMAAVRAERAASWEEPKKISETDRPSPEQIKSLMDDFAKRMEGKDMLERNHSAEAGASRMSRRNRKKPFDPAAAAKARAEREANAQEIARLRAQPSTAVNVDKQTGRLTGAWRLNCFNTLLTGERSIECREAVNWLEELIRTANGENGQERRPDFIRGSVEGAPGQNITDAMIDASRVLSAVEGTTHPTTWGMLLGLLKGDEALLTRWRTVVMEWTGETNPTAQAARVRAACEHLAWAKSNIKALMRAQMERKAANANDPDLFAKGAA
ncbi:hypothetical protein LTR94_023851 [Friedmanniomyces endolithicus]|nr:hypothetical protein LTR94_023851 [Friedmanniomyces endolithicus]